MCIKFCWPLRELLWALSHFQLTFWILTLLYVDAVLSICWMFVMQQLAHVALIHKSLCFPLSLSIYIYIYIYIYTHDKKYIDSHITTHEIMRFHNFFFLQEKGDKLSLLEFGVPEDPITSMNGSYMFNSMRRGSEDQVTITGGKMK